MIRRAACRRNWSHAPPDDTSRRTAAEADRGRDRRETKIGDLGDSRREGNEVARLRDEVRDLKAQLKTKKKFENMINKAVPQNVRESFMA